MQSKPLSPKSADRQSRTVPRRVTLGHRPILFALGVVILGAFPGCTAILAPISGVPAHRLPRQVLAPPKNDLVPVDISRLRQEPPREYLVDARDILGIYIEGVLGTADEPPPVHFPPETSNLPPAIGYPIPVREDGTIALPLVPPIQVRGLTVTQVQNVIQRAYTIDQNILQPGKDRIIVTMFKERTYRVTVMRQDGGQAVSSGGAGGGSAVIRDTRGQTIALPAYQNDVMHALAETGGLPGLNAKNEVKILRSTLMDVERRDEFVRAFYAAPPCDPCLCRPPIPPDPAIVRIPLRLPPGVTPTFRRSDIILEEGDIILIESRDREVFYTGGLLGGGQYQLPRDYDLDVLSALAITGRSVIGGQGSSGNGGGGGGGGFGGGLGPGAIGGLPPGQLFILRKTPCNDQITIAVDLNRAIRDPKSRPLIQPEDILILQYRPREELLNFGLGTFFTYGIAQALNNN